MPKIMYNKREYTGSNGNGGSSTLVSNDIILTLLETNWVLDEVSNLYKQSFNIEGITAEVNPIVGLATSDIPVSEEMTEAYSHIVEVSTEDGSVTFYSDVLLTIAIPVVLKGVGEVEGSTLTDVNNLVEAYNGLRNDFNEIQWALEEGSELNAVLLASDITASGEVTLKDSLNNYQYLFLATNSIEDSSGTDYGSILLPINVLKFGDVHTVGAYRVGSTSVALNNWTIEYVDDTTVSIALNNTTLRPRIYGIKDANVTLGTQSADDPDIGSGDTIVVSEEWKLLGSATGTTPIDLSQIDYNELLICVKHQTQEHVAYNFHIVKEQLTETPINFGEGSGVAGLSYYADIKVGLKSAQLLSLYLNNVAFTTDGLMTVYYKEASTHILNPNEDGLELLWENTNLTTFNPQTIEVEWSKYDKIIIEYGYYSTLPTVLYSKEFIPKLNTSFFIDYFNACHRSRTVTFEQNGISFGNAVYLSAYTTSIPNTPVSNDDVVPYAIYGIKNNGGVTISKKDVYSTEEREVGTDVDGSPIYEKTYYSDSCNLTTLATLDSNLTSKVVKRVISMTGASYVGDGNEGWQPVYGLYVEGKNYDTYLRCGASGVQLVCTNRTVTKYHITIRYVKA